MVSVLPPEAGEPIRDAASIVLLRGPADDPQVLMGQRGGSAVFMPSKYVFPGGAVDAADASVPMGDALNPVCTPRLTTPTGPSPAALAAAAIRELWEETGLALARPGSATLPDDWQGFAQRGLVPDASGLRFIFRAITPPGRTRRFDARFFLADAGSIMGDPDDFSAASDELGHLHWLPLSATRKLDLPFITEVILAEVAVIAHHQGQLPPVPFFDNSGPVPTFRRIG
ncbi:MAG: DNA mismatch repair protein MutT [Cereibacter sphaeroides]|uniref:DNA mismatch repair protein MutT n=1 Tax=Cereibacter sphaeroides TaxID=1063 RepID=A0A2W5SEH1_CERSP|nr:MAG: DNA mismatch repair protein MutT [Cereibacter sphaeroides]